MWLFTQHGMVSIVAHRTEPGMLLVRARTKQHLETILEPINKDALIPIIQTPDGDYEYRAIICRNEAEEMIDAQLDILDYANFKGRCDLLARNNDSRNYANMLHSIWHTVHRALAKNVGMFGPHGKRKAKRQYQPDVEGIIDRHMI